MSVEVEEMNTQTAIYLDGILIPIFNFEREKQYFEQFQFRLVKVVYRNIYVSKTSRQTVPVIRIYSRAPGETR